ncbi:sensor histidine kinase [Gottschalkiaceae bacterium SANA]|nr:sensor histidine kinase [Gottschalkiaceae bacterium SANA]
MDLGVFEWTFIITNIFGTYTIYKFMMVFFKRDNVNKKVEAISYGLYCLIIALLFLYLKIPIVMLVSNLLLLFGLTFNYQSNLLNRILSIVFISIIFLCIEMIIVVITGAVDITIIHESRFQSIYGLILIKIVSYVVALLMNNFKSVRQGKKIPGYYWFCIFFIPTISLYLLLLIYSKNLEDKHLIWSMLGVLFINFSVFYLYDSLSRVFAENADKRVIQAQNRYYEKQLSVMQSSLKSTRALRHDMNNHFTAITSMAKKHNAKDITDYVLEISNIRSSYGEFVSTGIAALDSVVNFKIQEAMQSEVVITTDIVVPEQMQISAFDLTTILGNLLDNAIDGTKTLTENRRIDIQIRCSMDQLFIHVKNTFDGHIKVQRGKLMTSNKDKVNHGFGIENIKRSVEKYRGIYDYEVDDKKFIASVILYVAS